MRKKEREREREREIMKCEPVELSFDKHFSSTFSPLRSSLSEMLHRSYSESITEKF